MANSGAFRDALHSALMTELGGDARLKSYTATGWHAQISKLTSSPRGYEAAAAVGLSASERTLRGWLAETREPTAANRAKIAEAYDRMARRPWPREVESKTIEVSGIVAIGRKDKRDRGTDSAPFRVNGANAGFGRWRDVQRRWEAGDIDPVWLADEWFADLIEDDMGEFSDPPTFSGSTYTVVFQ